MIAVCIKTYYDVKLKRIVAEGTPLEIDPKSMIAKYYGKISPLGDKDPKNFPVMTQAEFDQIRSVGGFGNGKKLLKKLMKDPVRNADQIKTLAEGMKKYLAKDVEAEKLKAKEKEAEEAAAVKEAEEAAAEAEAALEAIAKSDVK